MPSKNTEKDFWLRVDKQGPSDCWLWLGYKLKKGYGQIKMNGKRITTHKYSWEIDNGPIPKDYVIQHTCGNKHCANPNHMQLKPVSPLMEERFWNLIDKNGPGGCWLWTGTKVPFGYGNMKITKSREQVYVHRYSWEIHNGPIPDGMLVCHKCDVPSCVNPLHLFLGSQTDNMQDCANKGRSLKGTKHWNCKLKEADVMYIRKLWMWTEDKPRGRKGLVGKLVKLFDVNKRTIQDIIDNKTWKHLKLKDPANA